MAKSSDGLKQSQFACTLEIPPYLPISVKLAASLPDTRTIKYNNPG